MKKNIRKALSIGGKSLAFLLLQYGVTCLALVFVRRWFPLTQTLQTVVWWLAPSIVTAVYFLLILRKTVYMDRAFVAIVSGLVCFLLIPFYQAVMKAVPMAVVDVLPIDVICCLFDLWHMPIIRCVLLDMPIVAIYCLCNYRKDL